MHRSQTIFERAAEYALKGPIRNGCYQIVCRERDEGEKRLHLQALKILDMAIGLAKEEGYTGGNALRVAVCDQVDALQERYASDWKLEGDGWYYRDFGQPAELHDTLGFLWQMGITFERLDKNDIRQAVHLRMSPHDYGVIFTPETHAVARR